MKELINFSNDDAVRSIGEAIKEKKFDVACNFLIGLNEWRVSNNLTPYSISDVLFMNLDIFGQDDSKKEKSVYVIHFDDGTVKIGVSKVPEKRMKVLSKASGKKIIESWHSELLNNAFCIERKLHKHFSESRLEGEYFKTSYKEVVKQAKEMTMIS